MISYQVLTARPEYGSLHFPTIWDGRSQIVLPALVTRDLAECAAFDACIRKCELPRAVGDAFAAVLRERLSDSEWHAMRYRNRFFVGCASHDFCDANMAMDEAFVRVLGRDIVLESDVEAGLASGERADDDRALWSDAWIYAKRMYLTET